MRIEIHDHFVCVIFKALVAEGVHENLVDSIIGFAETEEALMSSVDKITFFESPNVLQKPLGTTLIALRYYIKGP